MLARTTGSGVRRLRRRILGVSALLLALTLSNVLPHAASAEDAFDAMLSHNFQFSGQQLTRTTGTISTTSYPNLTGSSGNWNTTGASSWTSGFFPGNLWFMYERTGDATWRTKAQNWQAGIESQKNDTSTHDVGFMIFNSFGNGYRLTGNDAYRQVVLTAARSLATRYNPVVGCIKSWNGPTSTDFRVIMDNMMNLELLFWAAKNGGDPAWYNMALSHALKTREHHVRADGSTYQIVNYNPSTGGVQSKSTHQGYSTESTWSRGQAWAVHGFTMTYRETGDTRFLDTARQTADYFIANLPSDNVPYWDFELPSTLNEPRDSSAAAIAASGLLELSQLETDGARKQTYRNKAQDILRSLSSSAYLAEGTTNAAILLHGTQNKPSGNYDTGLIFGDYYFLEAMLRWNTIAPAPTSTPTLTPTSSSTLPTSTSTVTATATPTRTSTATPIPSPTATATGTPLAGTTVTYSPVADAHVSQASPTSANSTASQLQAVGAGTNASEKQAFIRFDVTGLPAGASVSSAKLRLVVANDSTSGGIFQRVTNNTWAEAITWNTKPAIDGPQLASLGAVALDQQVEVTLPAGTITGNGSYSFAITMPSANTNTLGYASREASIIANRPQLLIALASSTTPTNTPTAANTPTATSTHTPTATSTRTATPTNTATATSTRTATPTNTATATSPTATATSTPSPTATSAPDFTPSPTATSALDFTPSPTATATSAPSPTATSTPSPTATPVSTSTQSPTATSTTTSSPTATSTTTSSPTALPTPINLALNKLTTVSSVYSSSFQGDKAVDGNTTTSWRTQRRSTAPSEWIIVDLDSSLTIGEVVLKWNSFYATVYTIEVSADGNTWTTVFTTTSGDGGTDTITLGTATSARYVKLNSTAWLNRNDRVSLTEIEIHQGRSSVQPTTIR